MDHRLRVRQRFSGFYDVDVREDAPASDIDGANFDAQVLSYKSLCALNTRPSRNHHKVDHSHVPPTNQARNPHQLST